MMGVSTKHEVILAVSLLLSLAARCLSAAETARGEAGVEEELQVVIEQYNKEVLDLPREEIKIPGRDSQLETYLNRARQENLVLRMAQFTLRADQMQSREARAGLLPDVSLNELYDREEDSATYATQFQVTQPLWSGELWGNYRQAQAIAQSSQFSRDSIAQTLDASVAQGYFNLLKLDEVVEENIGNVRRLKQQTGIVKDMFAAGNKRKVDVLYAELALSTGNAQALQSLLNSRKQLVELNRLLNRPPHSPIKIRELGKVNLFRPDLDSCLALVEAHRPDIKAQEAQVRAAEARVAQAKQNFWPAASVVGTYGTTETDEISFSDPDLAVQLRLSVPVFTSGRNLSLLQSAKFLQEREMARLEDTRDQARAEVASTLLTISTTISQIHILWKEVGTARERMRIDRELYTRGRILTTDLMDSFAELIDAREQLISAVCGYQISMSELKREIGGVHFPVPEVVKTLDFGSLFSGAEDYGAVLKKPMRTRPGK